MATNDAWPELPYAAWKDTVTTLHLWTQIVGKIPVAADPWLNHSWHVTFHLTARGMHTPLIFVGDRALQIGFDFVDHALHLRTSDGGVRDIALKPMTTAAFYAAVMDALAALGTPVHIDRLPNEVENPIAFDTDTTHASYDADFANRHWRILVRTQEVFAYFRTAWLGKASPIHFFWGSFDLAMTRFSGRRAPLLTGSRPGLPDAVAREAYSHEVSSAGFWAGGDGVEYPAYYSYAYPSPDAFAAATVRPAKAFFHKDLGQFILPYDAVRTATDPKQALLEFLQTTYTAAAETGHWDRTELECDLGQIGRPRQV